MDDFYSFSTSTQIALLHQQIDSLSTYGGWLIGGVTLTITVLLALFALVQFIYQRRLQKAEIEVLEQNLLTKIYSELQTVEQKLKEFSEVSTQQIDFKLSRKIKFLEGDLARSYALSCEEDDLHSTAFGWWLRAATQYESTRENDLLTTALKSAKEALEKIDGEQVQIDDLFENAPRINKFLDALEKNHKTEVEILRETFKEKIKQRQPALPIPKTN